MKIEFFRYSLTPKSSLGAIAQPVPRSGALLKVYFSKDRIGYSDCHPWFELGDLPLQDQLNLLQRGEVTSLTAASLQFAQVDALARSQNRSVWEGLQVPPSHALVTDLKALTPDRLAEWKKQGFQKIKLKVGKNLSTEVDTLKQLSSDFKQLKLQLRLDFNSMLHSDQFERFLDGIGSTQECLDLVEDPIPYHPESWEKLQRTRKLRLALDRVPNGFHSDFIPGSFSVLVLKPALQKKTWAMDLARTLGVSILVTSYLDHPLGQLGATWTAAQLSQNPSVCLETCGLASHTVYQEDFWIQQLRMDGAQLIPPEGMGFGMDESFQKLSWNYLGVLDGEFESRLAVD
jgi:O-succinylbenzoate synthase